MLAPAVTAGVCGCMVSMDGAEVQHRGWGLAEPLRVLLIALAFLTRLPLGWVGVGHGDLTRASAAFPLVGALIAGAGIGVRAAAEPLWGAPAATAAAVLVTVVLTGAFHEDGLADACDGLWGGWDPQQRVAIMRDSRLGTYGTVALVASLGLQVALLAPLDVFAFAAALLAGHVLGRAGIVLMVRWLAPVTGGSSADVAGRVGPLGLVVVAVTVGVVLASTLAWWGLAAALLAVAVVAGWRVVLSRKLGGVTGDALGATVQLVLLAVVALVSALAQAELL